MAGRTLSAFIQDDLYTILKTRADINHRSLSGEVVFLLEAGLGIETESTRNMLQLLTHLTAQPDQVTSASLPEA